MRRLIFLLFLCGALPAIAQQNCIPGTPPTTPHIGLFLPFENQCHWGLSWNANATTLDNLFPLSIALGGNGTNNPQLLAGTNITITGSWGHYTISATGGGGGGSGTVSPGTIGMPAIYTGSTTVGSGSIALGTADVSGILGIPNGGTGSSSPGLLQGSCIIITGVFPNQTITKSGAAGCGSGGGGSYATLKVMSAYANAQAALNDMSPGDTMMVDGTYSLCNGTLPTSNVVLEGSGMQSGALQCGTANAPVLTGSGNGQLIQYLTIKHTVNPTAGGDGLVITGSPTSTRIIGNLIQQNYNGLVLGPSSFGVAAWNYVQRNNMHGIQFKSDGISQVMQWGMSGNLSQQNLGDGYNFVLGPSVSGLQITCPVFSGETAYGNAGHGWNISGSAATASGISDCFWGASSFASINNQSGFYWDPGPNGGRNFQIAGGFSELSGYYNGPAGFSGATQTPTHVGAGLEITGSCDTTISPQVLGMIFWENAYSGAISSCPGTQFTNINAFKSGMAGSANSWQRAGVAIRATNIGVHGGYMRNSGSTQIYGVDVSNNADTPDTLGVRCDPSTVTCINASTSPANGFQSVVGNRRLIAGTGAPSMACSNGDEYRRTDAGNFSTLYVCKNAAWGAVN